MEAASRVACKRDEKTVRMAWVGEVTLGCHAEGGVMVVSRQKVACPWKLWMRCPAWAAINRNFHLLYSIHCVQRTAVPWHTL